MTDEKLTAEQAVEILRRQCRGEVVPIGEQKAALAALDGLHVYTSRFKPGDRITPIVYLNGEWEVYGTSTITKMMFGTDGTIYWFVGRVRYEWNESDCFPTRELAQAEADRRNLEA